MSLLLCKREREREREKRLERRNLKGVSVRVAVCSSGFSTIGLPRLSVFGRYSSVSEITVKLS